MTKILLISFMFFVGHVFAQNADTSKVNFIFGCSCCADTLKDYIDKTKIYVLTENKTRLTAYKKNKKKWSIIATEIFENDSVSKVICMDFYEVNKAIVIRVNTDKPNRCFNIDPATGYLIIVKPHKHKVTNK